MADLQGKPTFERNGCPECKKFKTGCTSCGKEIPAYENMPKGVGFQSNSISHWHFVVIGDKQGLSPVTPKLCRDCYLKDYNENNPERQLKVADLPRELAFK